MTIDKQQIPFAFVLDELVSLRPTVKRVFGFTYLYLGGRLLCALRDGKQKSGSNGIWLFTTTEHLESLGREFPELSRRYHWRSGKNAWVILPSKLGEFEEYAFKACELILNGDRRIGRTSRGRISDFRSQISD
jgi:hypothetical protein